MPDFSFAEWYTRMGYHRRGRQKACSEALGISPRHIQLLRINERAPSQTLIKLCHAVEWRHESKD